VIREAKVRNLIAWRHGGMEAWRRGGMEVGRRGSGELCIGN